MARDFDPKVVRDLICLFADDREVRSDRAHHEEMYEQARLLVEQGFAEGRFREDGTWAINHISEELMQHLDWIQNPVLWSAAGEIFVGGEELTASEMLLKILYQGLRVE